MQTATFKKRSIKVKKRNSPGNRIKSAKRRVTKRMTREFSQETYLQSRGTNISHMNKRLNMSATHKNRAIDKSTNQQSVNTSYNAIAFESERKKRIYSAKPNLNDVRRFAKSNIKTKDNYMIQLSPSEKKNPDSSILKFNTQTAPSTDYQRTFYNPYQTVTKMTDNFLNIEQPHSLAHEFSRSSVRTSESTISNFTQVQNSKTLGQLQILEKIREKNSIANEFANLKNIDCRKLLLSANHQMKKINHQLNNLISNGETHIEISRNDPTEFEILDGIPLMCKVSCKGLTGPAKFFLKHRTKGKVRSFTSFKQTVAPIFRSGNFKFE